MEKELLELLLHYSLNDKIGDEYIERIVAIVVKYRKLERYVKGIEYVKLSSLFKDNITLGSYITQTNKIDIDLNAVKAYIDIYDDLFHQYSKKEKQIFKGILIMQKVLHELEHANQKKLTKDKNYKNSTEVKLLSYAFLADKDREKYIEFYDFNPVERMAEDNSFIICLNIINQKNDELNKVLLYMMKHRLDILSHAYKKMSDYNYCPTELYLKSNCLDQVWKDFNFYNSNSKLLRENVMNKYNLNQRLHLGLYLTEKEYKKLN